MISKVQFRLQFLVLLWGFTGVFGKLVTLSALPMVWYRVLIAAIAVFIYMKYKKIDFKVSKNTLLKLLGIGGIVGMHWFTFYLSIKVSNVSIALSTLSMGALFTAVLEPIFYRRKINLYEVLLAVVVSACVVVIFNASPEYKMGIIYGIICSFLSACGWYTITASSTGSPLAVNTLICCCPLALLVKASMATNITTIMKNLLLKFGDIF